MTLTRCLGGLIAMFAVTVALSACGSKPALSLDSTCGEYRQADSTDRDAFIQSVITSSHSSRRVDDLEGMLSYNCGSNLDRKLSSLLNDTTLHE